MCNVRGVIAHAVPHIYCFSDVSVDVPDEIDLSVLRGVGLQPGEVELPEGQPEAAQQGQSQPKKCSDYP